MAKEITIEVVTGIVVFGSVFGVSHWRKITSRLRKILPCMQHPPKPPQHAG